MMFGIYIQACRWSNVLHQKTKSPATIRKKKFPTPVHKPLEFAQIIQVLIRQPL